MRWIVACLACLRLIAGEAAPLPASTQKLVDDAAAAALKAKLVYDQAMAKEQAKLATALVKEQERETKKGNLDGALAIKSLILEVQGGLLQKRTEEAGDLLGDAVPSKGTLAILPPAELVTDSQLSSGRAQPNNAPAELTEFLQRATAMRLPKGDASPLNFGATSVGMVAVYNGGGGRNAELWDALLKAGFRRVIEGENQWFVLNAKPGDRFTVFDPPGTMAQIEVYALRFKTAR